MSGQSGERSVVTLLSHALVAYIIEFDNEFEHQMPHRTGRFGATPGAPFTPLLVSLAMYANCMRFVGAAGVSVGELEHLARTPTDLAGMTRWGYVTVAPNPQDKRAKLPHSDWIIHATPAGRRAQEIWQPLFGVIEARWRDRFGSDRIDALRQTLAALVGQLDAALPDCLPLLNRGFFSSEPKQLTGSGLPVRQEGDLPLSALLSRVLVAFAIEFERESDVSLAISANVLRLLDEAGVPIRDLPLLSGVSKEAISVSTGYLQKHGFAVIEPLPAPARGKRARLTPKGRQAQAQYNALVGEIEARWQARFGDDLTRLRELLGALDSAPGGHESQLFAGLQPYPDGWRAFVRPPEVLPDFPLVTHRGGYPDGS